MASKEFIDEILNYIKENNDKIEFNQQIFDIMEGDLMSLVAASLKKQLKADAARIAIERAAPINIWNKIINKLSTLYSGDVTRITELPADQELVDYYMKDNVDKHLGDTNHNYNSYKWSSIEIYEDPDLQELKFRSIPSNQFLVYSSNKINKLKPTAFIKFMGVHIDINGGRKNKYWVYTENEFIPILDDGTIVREDMEENEGINPFGVIPFEYISMSDYLLIPMPDKDTLRMTILIPVLITDQNFGSMFLSFPLVYTVDADSENMPSSPNNFLNIKSTDPDKTATIGVVKAEPNLDAQMAHALKQLSIWLESRDINASSIGSIDANNFPSGISKAISEADTSKNTKRQATAFENMEVSFWKRLAIMHNTLAKVGRIKNRKLFSDPENLVVKVQFPDEKIIESRTDKIARLKAEKDAGFTSRKRAIAALNPKMNADEIEVLIQEIDEENTNTFIEEIPDGDETPEIQN